MKRNFLFAGLVALSLLGSAGTTLGNEIVSGGGGGGGGAASCFPVSSLTAKGDPKIGETGLASVQMGWSVKPCNAGQAVTVVATITNWNTKAVVYSNLNAPLNGKITVFVQGRQIYNCTITVLDALTGEVLGTSTTGATTIAKGGV